MDAESDAPQAFEITPIEITLKPKIQLAKYFPSPTPAKTTAQDIRNAAAHAQTSGNTSKRPAPDDPNGTARTDRVEMHN